jgi:hypothetical protein
MADISTWNSLASNNTASSPDGAPEGMAPSGVNDVLREIMAAVHRWYIDAQWTDYGYTHTRTSSSTFTLSGDYSTVYHVGRRVRMSGSSTAYASISAVAYAAGITTVTVEDVSVPSTLSAVALSAITATDTGEPSVREITLTLTHSGGGDDSALTVSSTVPSIALNDTDGATDEKKWDIVSVASVLTFRAFNDASTSATNYMTVSRSGYTVPRVAFGAPINVYSAANDPSGSNGDIYYNTSTGKFRGFAAGSWTDLH